MVAIDYTRSTGFISKAIDATFITLIPKRENLDTFEDFRPISLCNLVYKVISKVIANRIKPLLVETLSLEQFGFLRNRQIFEVVGVTQECLHSIKVKKLEALILKMDLNKAYDHVDWGYLRLMLLQSGLSLLTTNWIMAHVSSVCFVVLINGSPTYFFSSSRGLR